MAIFQWRHPRGDDFQAALGLWPSDTSGGLPASQLATGPTTCPLSPQCSMAESLDKDIFEDVESSKASLRKKNHDLGLGSSKELASPTDGHAASLPVLAVRDPILRTSHPSWRRSATAPWQRWTDRLGLGSDCRSLERFDTAAFFQFNSGHLIAAFLWSKHHYPRLNFVPDYVFREMGNKKWMQKGNKSWVVASVIFLWT